MHSTSHNRAINRKSQIENRKSSMPSPLYSATKLFSRFVRRQCLREFILHGERIHLRVLQRRVDGEWRTVLPMRPAGASGTDD